MIWPKFKPPDTETLNMAIQRRDTLHQLINPMGLGNFMVLVQAKNLEVANKPLKGLTIPPLSSTLS